MKKTTTTLLALITTLFACMADNIVIKNPGFFDSPVRDGHAQFPDSLVFPRDAEEIHLPDIGVIGRLSDYGFTRLKKVSFGDIDYVSGGLFVENNTIEEIEFNGLVGHFDCSMAIQCPNLRKIVFHGPVSSTGGLDIAYDCPRLDSVIFESAVVSFGLSENTPQKKCPNLKGYTNPGAFIEVCDSLTAKADIQRLATNPLIVSDLERLARWQAEVLTAKKSGWMRANEYESAKYLLPVLKQLNSGEYDSLKKAMEYAWALDDDVKTHLEILKESPAYGKDNVEKPDFIYAAPDDTLLTLSRERFNLDSIAGTGDDISRIKNLLYWVHDNIPHNGNNGLAPGRANLRNTYDSAVSNKCGYNCRALAICLTEALLAEGIPARYLTCESKAWDTDNDCHVICVAWSESLQKWVWADPTFAAYVTDENGLLLHPGEVRFRLQNDMPVILNKDANWNHRIAQTKEKYLDDYMAKNLYIISANTHNQAEPERESDHSQGKTVALVPSGSNYTNAHYITTDDEWFWQPPQSAD